MKRRAGLWAAGAVAALAGVGVYVGRTGLAPPAAPPAPGAALWSLRFGQPQGGELSLARWRGQPLVLNFWATWCAPCVKEMPELDRFWREFGARGWAVVGLAADKAEAVEAFLKRVPVSFPIGVAGPEVLGLARDLGNTQGGLPFTVLFGRDGQVLQRRLGETSYSELAQWAASPAT